MKSKSSVLFWLIFFFCLFIRIYFVTKIPEGFDQTEAAFGYNAYSVLKSGRDEYGKFLPLVLQSIGDYKLSGYMYWQIPFIAVFGLNEFSTRLSTITAGMISLLLVFYIVYTVTNKIKLALLTFFFTGIAPWHIILSRMAYDPMIALMFLLASLAFFATWYKSERIYKLIGSAFTLCWAVGTYYAVWVLLPFVILYYGIHILKKPQRKTHLFVALIIVSLPVLMAVKLLSITQGQRFGQDSTFQVHAIPLLNEQVREDQHEFPLFVTRIFHNKVIFYTQSLLQNLFKNLSFDFIFLSGDKLDRRFSVPYQGVLYLWMAPFVLFGILNFWKNQPTYNNLLLLGTIGIIFLGSAFSELGSETERTLFSVPLFCFLTSYELITACHAFEHKGKLISTLVPGVLALLLAFNVAYFNHQYYWHANAHEPWGRNFGMHEMLIKLKTLENQYTKIVIPDNAYIFYYFYNKVDPQVAWAESTSRLDKENFLGVRLRKNIGKYLTIPISCPAAGRLHILYVCTGTKIPKNSKVIDTLYFRDEQPAYVLLEFSKKESTEIPPKNVNFIQKYGLIEDESDAYWKDENEIQ